MEIKDLKTSDIKKHLIQFNKDVKEEYIIKGVSKMKKEEALKKFKLYFEKDGNSFYPKDTYLSAGISYHNYDNLIKSKPKKQMKKKEEPKKKKEEPKKVMKKKEEPKKETKKKEEAKKKEEPKPEPKKEEPKPKKKRPYRPLTNLDYYTVLKR